VSEESTIFRVVQQQMGQNARVQTLESVESTFDTRTVAAFLQLSSLRGFWPMSSVDNAGAIYDLTGQGRTLTRNGNPVLTYSNLAPYYDFDGTGDYFNRADEAGLDILGSESYVATSVRGLTLGGWFQVDAVGSAFGLISKWNDVAVNQRAYLLRVEAANTPRLFVSTTGIDSPNVTSSVTVGTFTWFFVVARYDNTSGDLDIFVNNTQDTNAGVVGAALFNSNADLNIGAFNNGASGQLNGRASMCFLCAAALGDVAIHSLFNQTRQIFQV
jgi:hypothetical protein